MRAQFTLRATAIDLEQIQGRCHGVADDDRRPDSLFGSPTPSKGPATSFEMSVTGEQSRAMKSLDPIVSNPRVRQAPVGAGHSVAIQDDRAALQHTAVEKTLEFLPHKRWQP